MGEPLLRFKSRSSPSSFRPRSAAETFTHIYSDVITIIGGYVRHVETGDGKEQNTFVETRRFAKALRLPYGPVKPEEVKAKLEDGGVLRLEITKSDSEEGPHQIEVE